MRYYVYLDREFITSLFSTIDDYNWDIQAVEYSTEYESNVEYNVNMMPGVDFSSEYEKSSLKDDDDDIANVDFRFKEARKRNNSKLEVATGRRNGYNKRVARKYFNLEDVSNARNFSFYNKLIKEIETSYTQNEFFCIEKGEIIPCNIQNRYLRQEDLEDECFFSINDKKMWLNKEKLSCNLAVIASLTDEVNVIGFSINKNKKSKIYKVIALYISGE